MEWRPQWTRVHVWTSYCHWDGAETNHVTVSSHNGLLFRVERSGQRRALINIHSPTPFLSFLLPFSTSNSSLIYWLRNTTRVWGIQHVMSFWKSGRHRSVGILGFHWHALDNSPDRLDHCRWLHSTSQSFSWSRTAVFLILKPLIDSIHFLIFRAFALQVCYSLDPCEITQQLARITPETILILLNNVKCTLYQLLWIPSSLPHALRTRSHVCYHDAFRLIPWLLLRSSIPDLVRPRPRILSAHHVLVLSVEDLHGLCEDCAFPSHYPSFHYTLLTNPLTADYASSTCLLFMLLSPSLHIASSAATPITPSFKLVRVHPGLIFYTFFWRISQHTRRVICALVFLNLCSDWRYDYLPPPRLL